MQWQSFLADWTFFAVKILKIRKMEWNFGISYSKVLYNLYSKLAYSAPKVHTEKKNCCIYQSDC